MRSNFLALNESLVAANELNQLLDEFHVEMATLGQGKKLGPEHTTEEAKQVGTEPITEGILQPKQ